MNELSTKVFEFDFQFILDNYLDRRLWKKKWLIFKYGNLEITVKIYLIDVVRSQVQLEVEAEYFGSGIDYWNRKSGWSFYLPLEKENINFIALQNKLVGTAIYCIESIETGIILYEKGYREAEELDEIARNNNVKVAKEILKKMKITNKKVCELFIDSYCDSEKTAFAEDYLRFNRHKKMTEFYLAWIFFADKNDSKKDLKEEIAQIVVDEDYFKTVQDKLAEELNEEEIAQMAEEKREEYADKIGND